MNDNNLKEIQEKIKSKRKDRDGLNSQERQAAYTQKCIIEAKEAKISATFLRVVYGWLALAGIIYFWYSIYNMTLMSSLGIISGLIAVGIFKTIYPNGIDPKNKIQRYIFLTFGIVIIFLMNNHTASDFIVMFLPSVMSAFFLFGIIKSLPYNSLGIGVKPARYSYGGHFCGIHQYRHHIRLASRRFPKNLPYSKPQA